MLLNKFTQKNNTGQICGICNSCNSGCNSCNEGCYAMNANGFNLKNYCRASYYACSTDFSKCYNTGSCTTNFSNNAVCSKYQGCGTCEICQSNYNRWSCTENNNLESKCYLCVDCHSAWGSYSTCSRCNNVCQTDNGCTNCNSCNEVCNGSNECGKCYNCQSLNGTQNIATTTDMCTSGNENECSMLVQRCAAFYKSDMTCNLTNDRPRTYWWCYSENECINKYQDRDICYGNNSWCSSCNTKDAADECVYCELDNGGDYCATIQGCVACEGTCQSKCNSCQLCNSCLTHNTSLHRNEDPCSTCVQQVGTCRVCDRFDMSTRYCYTQVNSPVSQCLEGCSNCNSCVSCQTGCQSCEYCNTGCQTCNDCIGNNI